MHVRARMCVVVLWVWGIEEECLVYMISCVLCIPCQACMHAHTHARAHTAHTYTRACTHTHTHTHTIHTDEHTLIMLFSSHLATHPMV